MSLADTAVPIRVTFRSALLFWFKLGFISFGGPAGQISLMHTELVDRRRWISEGRFMHALNYAMLLPGPEAQQLATYIGWLMHGTVGGIVAGTLFVLPSLAILCLLSWVYMAYGEQPAIAGMLYGIKPAVTAIVAFAAYRIGSRALRNGALWMAAAGALVAITIFNTPFPAVVLAAALIGFAGGRLAPEKFRIGGHARAEHGSSGPAVIDDHVAIPQHAGFSRARTALHVSIGLSVWAAAEGLLFAGFGWDGPLSQMGWFFTKAALVTFGGAYAVLPYVYQGAVEGHGWLTSEQMIDGLALGETTPGPLIMVVAFVGFVGAWNTQVFGPDSLLAAGIAGAAVATFFTFLPSFLFILIGGPAVEATRGDIKLTAPLTVITAAVVGVILSLAVFFAWHVLWPQANAAEPFAGPFDWVSLLISIAALAGLWRFGIGVIPVIGASALAGLIVSYIT
jgi:chromate transporter